ncbi:MAG: pilus assembly protein PilM [bacterium]|nr:pilus assembly protein PilM [bacterium]
MLGLWKKKRGVTLTIDVGSSALKFLVTSGVYPDNFAVRDFRVVHTSAAGKQLSAGDLSAVLRHTLTQLNIATPDVRTVISGRQAVVRIVELPRTSREELHKSVAFQLSRYVPLNPEDSVFDCAPMAQAPARDGWQKCMIVASRRTVVDAVNDLFRTVNLVALIMDVEPICVINAFLAGVDDHDREAGIARIESGGIGLVHMGAVHTDVCILRGRVPVACRSLDMGEMDVIKDYATQQRLEYAEALAAYQQAGEMTAEVRTAYGRCLGRILTEVKTSFEYCKREFDFSCERLYLTGGMADKVGAAALAKELYGVAAFRLDPFVKVGLDALDQRIGEFRAVTGAFTPALGVALRALGL